VTEQQTILIVEDEPDIAELIAYHLSRGGYRTNCVHSAQLAIDVTTRMLPDLLVLDLMLPDMDGLEVCRRLRRENATVHTPILIVSARGEEADIVAGLELGADDYVTKPFSPRVLLARVRTILRRKADSYDTDASHNQIILAEKQLVIDFDRYEVALHGSPVDLTRSEFEILRCLAKKPGCVRTRDQIITSMHGQEAVLTSRTIDVHMTALRRKLGAAGRLIKTVRGVGYRIEDSAVSFDT